MIMTSIGNQVGQFIKRKQAEEELYRQNLRSQLFTEITLKVRQSLQIEEILQTTVKEVQKILNSDRVLIYQSLPDGSGSVVTEAVVSGFPAIKGQNITDPYFRAEYLQQYCLQQYRQRRIAAIADLALVEVQPSHVELLQQFGVKANLVVPILVKEELCGLLIVHQCTSSRQWSSFETHLLRELADQVGVAIAQALNANSLAPLPKLIIPLLALQNAVKQGVPYDFALIDMQMPETDGLTLGEQIKANLNIAKIPLIMLTSTNQRDEVQRALNVGFSAYLVKPVRASRLLDTIMNILGSQSELEGGESGVVGAGRSPVQKSQVTKKESVAKILL